MKMTAAANGAIRVLMACDEQHLLPMSDMAVRLNMAESTLAKTCNELMRLGYLEGRRGRKGGYRLAKPRRAIGVLEVMDRFEPREDMFPCRFNQTELCRLVADCALRAAGEAAYGAFRAELAGLTLADLGPWRPPPAGPTPPAADPEDQNWVCSAFK